MAVVGGDVLVFETSLTFDRLAETRRGQEKTGVRSLSCSSRGPRGAQVMISCDSGERGQAAEASLGLKQKGKFCFSGLLCFSEDVVQAPGYSR